MLHTELIKAASTASPDLLIALHGLGDSMEGYRWLPRALRMPQLNVLLVNAPDPYHGGFSWYDLDSNPGSGVERSYGMLKALLDGLPGQGFPTERTLLFGFSQGCLMSFETGLRYSRKLAGLVGISGYVHDPKGLIEKAFPVAREQEFLVTHGSHDALIPLKLVRPQIEQLRAAGIRIDFREYPKEHTVIEPEIEMIRNWISGRFGRLP